MATLKKLFEFYNSDNIYQEDEDSTVTHNKKEYSLNMLLKLSADMAVEYYPVDDMKWILEFTTVTPKRKKRAELDKPLLITKLKDKLVVLDGAHRLAKAVGKKAKTLPCKFIDDALLNLAKIKPKKKEKIVKPI